MDEATAPTHTNRLVNETSPYLLQHAHNPVDWYPWGEEAFAKAKEEDKPIFLSVGYSSCHWCHVMERESFESEAIAKILNEHFVNIKVDREERPDVDEIYMTAVQAMTGSGGWPMSVFLTPDLDPFFGGTYFPPTDAYGKPGFNTLLMRIAGVWKEKRDEVEQGADRLADHMRDILGKAVGKTGSLDASIFDSAVAHLMERFDRRDGGFGSAPKFPSSGGIAVLLRHHARTGDADALHAATHTLDKMATGGMYDHLGGGFARYSTDDQWLVPHFEKMLYDNGQLVQVYLEAYQVTKNPFYAEVARESLDYVLRDMTDAQGGFYSAEDADSEDEEGKFYLWRYEEVQEILGGGADSGEQDPHEDAKLFTAYYNVKPGGNFKSHEPYHAGLNILHTPRSAEAVAQEFGLSAEELKSRMAPMNAKMLEARGRRIRPGLDDKILTSWNALMITAMAQAYQVLGDGRYRDAAVNASRFILNEMTEDGELLRTHRHGESRLPAYLDDYAFLCNALVDVYEATFEPVWLNHASGLADTMIAKFWDTEHPGFYFTSDAHTHLLVRSRANQDNATPAGNSIAALALLRLAKLTDAREHHEKARALLEASHGYLSDYPSAFLKLMLAADYLVFPPKEIAIAGSAGGEDTARLLATVRENFIPNKVVAFVDPASPDRESVGERFPLLADKGLLDGRAAAYVCKDYACRRPTNSPDELLAQLNEQ